MRNAVRAQKERVARKAPKGHREHDASLFDLGVTLLHSSTMFDNPGDLGEAVAVPESVKRRPDASVDRAAVLSALGTARLVRFLRDKRRSRTELDTALEEHQEALEALRPEEPNALTYLSDLGLFSCGSTSRALIADRLRGCRRARLPHPCGPFRPRLQSAWLPGGATYEQ